MDRQINWNVWNKIYAAPLMKKVMEQADFPGPVIHAEDLYVTFVALYHAASFTGIPFSIRSLMDEMAFSPWV